MKSDKKFAGQLFEKLNRVKGDDETKTARKILKQLCDFRCLKDFTWQGTKKMKSFQDLHLIVEMMVTVLKAKYPTCDGMNIVMKVVQQRTKSAKEAWIEFLKKNESSSPVATSVASSVESSIPSPFVSPVASPVAPSPSSVHAVSEVVNEQENAEIPTVNQTN